MRIFYSYNFCNSYHAAVPCKLTFINLQGTCFVYSSKLNPISLSSIAASLKVSIIFITFSFNASAALVSGLKITVSVTGLEPAAVSLAAF